MEALKEIGIAHAELDEFFNGLVNTVISTAVKVLL